LKSPIDGVVVAIDMAPGQPTTGMPVMRLADTSKMICRVEVPLAEIERVALNAPVKMVASGLSEPLSGRVASISQIIGAPRLPNPNPMARVDWRSALVIVDIDPLDAPRAAKMIQGQVDVGILVGKE
jgi:multidrug resistance efflux pump